MLRMYVKKKKNMGMQPYFLCVVGEYYKRSQEFVDFKESCSKI